MSFFVTSSNPGKGADFGGLAGADRIARRWRARPAGGKTWRAYLSTTGPAPSTRATASAAAPGTTPRAAIAGSVDELHGTNQLTKATALTERGDGRWAAATR
jgi:hypothetical protein